MQREPSTHNQAELRVFIGACVRSVEQLEILLCLVRGDVERTLDEIVQKLRNHPESCERRLAELVADGLVAVSDSSPPRYRFAPQSETQARLVRALDEAYVERRHWIIDAIYAPALSGAHSFAESFKMRRDP